MARMPLSINHLIPAAGGGRVRYRITTDYQVLPETFFGRRVRKGINTASLERGRAIYCLDVASDDVLAALSCHVPDRGRLVIRTLAVRRDEGEPELWKRSRLDVVICKAYLHVFAAKIGRTAELLYDADTQEAANEATTFLGFRLAGRVTEIRPSGYQLLVQPKLGR